MAYDFFTETHPNTAFHLLGKIIQFRRAYFCTEDQELAEAMLKKCEEWDIQPGGWARAEAPKAPPEPEPVVEEMSAPEPPNPAPIRGKEKRRGYRL